MHDDIDLYFGTFAKTFAAIGGVTAGDRQVIEWIRNNARTNVFAKPLPMVCVAARDAATAMDMIAHRGEEHGIFVSGVMFPDVVLFRMITTVAYTDDDVDRTPDTFRSMRDSMELDLIARPLLVMSSVHVMARLAPGLTEMATIKAQEQH